MMIRWHMFLSPADLGLRRGLSELLSLARSRTPTVEDITLQDRQDAIVWHVLVRPGVPGESPDWHRWHHGYSYHVASERVPLPERTIFVPRAPHVARVVSVAAQEALPPNLQQMTLQL